MKYIFILQVLFFGLSNNLRAQNWAYVAKNEGGENTYVNKSNVTANSNGTKSAWTKFTKQNYRLNQNGRIKIIPSVTYFTYSEFNCSNKTIKDIMLIVKDNNGKILFNNTKKEWEQNEVYVVPGTISVSILNYVCNEL